MNSIRILLADDHAVVRKGIRDILLEAGDLDVIAEAANGEEAIALIDQLRPDVAVLDIQMPKRSGIEVCRHVRAQRWPIGLLVLTAYDDDPYVLAVLQAGANGYVLKTADADDLIRAVRDVHDGKSVLDPAIARKLMTQLAGDNDPRPIESLTPRELDVLKLAARGFSAHALGCDLADETAAANLARSVESLAPQGIAGLVHTAGGFSPGAPVADLTSEVWRHLFEINLTTAFFTTRALLPSLRRARGSIVYFSAAVALPGARVANLAAYAGAKSALVTLMRAVAAEERSHGVRANALAPTSIRTAANLASMGPNERYVEREDVARWVVWLCSPLSEPVTGQVIRLD